MFSLSVGGVPCFLLGGAEASLDTEEDEDALDDVRANRFPSKHFAEQYLGCSSKFTSVM